MSSWSSGKVHFRERKMPNRQPPISENIQNNVIEQSPSTIDEINFTSPSKYVSTKSKDKVNDAVVCAIALNEELYIDEWINYNLALGFSHIYIYDNSDTNTLKDKKSDKVSIIHFPGKTKQLEAYDIFTISYRKKHKWCAFIDCDEFIVLKKDISIVDFLNKYDKYSSIGLNWLMFGTANKTSYSSEPVTYRFQYCSNKVNIHIKCISKLESINKHITPHYAQLKDGHKVFGVNGNLIQDSFNYLGDTSIACIHHYYTKSEEEFVKKIKRGRADIIEEPRFSELNDIHSQNNDTYNSDAWDFYSKYYNLKQ